MTTSVTVPQNILSVQKYFWRVIAYNVCGASTPSAVWQFTIVDIAAIPNLTIWLRADTLVTVNGSNDVSAWGNNSDSVGSFTQPTPGSQPIWVANVMNGKPVIRFNGSSTFLSAGNNFDVGTNSRTAFIVGKANNSSYAYYAKSLAHNFVNNRYSLLNDGTNFYVLYADQTLFQANAFVAPTGPNIISHVIDRNQQQINLYVDGSKAAATVKGILPPSYDFTSPYRFNCVGAYNDGSDQGTVYNLNGDIAELIIYDSALPDSQRTAIEQYLPF